MCFTCARTTSTSGASTNGEHALNARVQHVFTAGNYGRVSLERIDTGETIEAEVRATGLLDLRLEQGDEVLVVFRHIRLFPKGQFFETDVKEEPAAPVDTITRPAFERVAGTIGRLAFISPSNNHQHGQDPRLHHRHHRQHAAGSASTAQRRHTAQVPDVSPQARVLQPLSSVKDRIGAAMIEEALRSGRINQDTILIDRPNSGNTRHRELAFVAAAALSGLKLVLTMPETMSSRAPQAASRSSAPRSC